MKRAACAVAALFFAFSILLPAASAEAPAIGASGAYLMEVSTGRALYEKDADVRLPMASTTKIMTALLAIEHGDLDETLTVPDEAYGTEGSSMYLNRGEKITLRDLLYGLMLLSGNDAAVAIACHVAGSREAFSALMNRRAEALGLMNTHFVTPNGLHDENHYTSARDLCVLGAAAMQNETFREIVSSTYYETASGDRARTLKNKNRVLWQYEGGCGVKTGFTKAAGRCLVFAAERDGMLLIGVLLNCPDMWDAAFALLDYGFETYERKRLVPAEAPLAVLPVIGGTKKTLEVYPKQAILYPVAKDGGEEISFSFSLPQELRAPVLPGDPLGTLTLMVDGKAASAVDLIAVSGVPAADIGYYFRLVTQAFYA